MGGGKETPRQKMIGMMYLVLTALLAMNVSKDILNGFITVNESMERTNHNFSDNTKHVMEAFEEAAKANPAAQPFLAQAKKAYILTTGIHEYIDKLKKEVVQVTEQKGMYKDSISKDKDLEKGYSMWFMDKKDNYDSPTHLLIGDNEREPLKGDGKGTTAVELRKEITRVHDELVKIVLEMQKNSKTRLFKLDSIAILKKIESMLPQDPSKLEDGVKETWETQNFYHLPLAAVITNLTKMQSDIKNVEGEIVSTFSGASGKLAIKFDKLTARVIAPSSYIQSGGKYVADVFLAASSSSMTADQLQIYKGATYDSIGKKCIGCDAVTNKADELLLEGGMGKYEVGASGVGEQKWGGVVKFKKPNGEFDYYPFNQTYMVAAPAAAISADAMNVFYIGVDNPVSVSAAGIAPSELVTTASGGGIVMTKSKPGVYNVRVTTAGEALISVSAKIGGASKAQGTKKFKCKRIPDPYASLAGTKTGQTVTKGEMQVANYIFAKMDNFDFDAKFTVTKWELMIVTGGKGTPVSGNGGSISSEAKTLLGKIGPGSRIILEVTAKGPDGSTRTLAPQVLRVK